MQELDATSDVASLTTLLSKGLHQGKCANLNHRILNAPSSSTGSAAWRSVPIWPTRSTPVATQVNNEKPEEEVVLTKCSREEIVCTISGPGTHITCGELSMNQETALVFDESCSGVVVSNIDIYGVLPLFFIVVRSDSTVTYAKCTLKQMGA
jgi:hypothetical protein